MKRLVAAAAALLLALGASAQGFIVKGGMNFDRNPAEPGTTSFTSWFAGVAVQSYSRSGFSVQPELIYRVNGRSFNDFVDCKSNSIDLPVSVQWGIDLLVAKPFIFVAPFLRYDLASTVDAGDNVAIPVFRRIVDNLEYGAGAGFGINIWQLQITGKYNWTFGRAGELKEFSFSKTPTFGLSLGFKF